MIPWLCFPLFLLTAAVCAAQPSRLEIPYPLDGSVFPPDFAPPTILWRDPSGRVASWRVEIKFAQGKPLRLDVPGVPFTVGEIDPRTISSSNKPPELTPEEKITKTWKPAPPVWAEIKQRSAAQPTTLTITGIAGGKPVASASLTFRTSKDPVGAPIFFRDVPLMPSEVEKGVIKPLAKPALPLVAWRLRYVHEESSRLMIDNLPTCMNCHSFSRDGKTLGLDVDGPQNDKGLYALVPVQRDTSIARQNVVAWSSFRGKLGSKIRVGFMSQVSPDGRNVVTMVSPDDVKQPNSALPPGVGGNFYVANFQDYRFLQVFYPTRGVLAWYSHESRKLQPLPGADDPRYVHTNASWSPDGNWIVFARAEARDPYPPGSKLAVRANDPNETPIQYDIYRIPFNNGRGGTPEPVRGASANGMSNSFAKVSPDGKWIVYVQARNGLLMRPDSQLYIVPFAGGEPRRMTANTALMNSWHSWSPNGRWLAFSSKSRGPYTKMFLTHVDESGQDSPAILVENSTAANRAVNIPEFVNIGPDEWLTFSAPATDFYRQTDSAIDLLSAGQAEAALEQFRKLLAQEPDDTLALNNYGAALMEAGDLEAALAQFRRAIEVDPENAKAYGNLGTALGRAGRLDEARIQLTKSLELNPRDARARSGYAVVLLNGGDVEGARRELDTALDQNPAETDALNTLGAIHARSGQFDQAIPLFERAVKIEPKSVPLRFNLGRALAAGGRLEEGLREVEQAIALGGSSQLVMMDRLAGLYAMAGRNADAVKAAKAALALAEQQGDAGSSADLRRRIEEYERAAAR